MNILLPRFHPIAVISLFVFYVLCLLEGGEANPDILRAEPLTAIMLGLGGAASLWSAWSAGERQDAAMRAQRKEERRLRRERRRKRKEIRRILGPGARAASQRLLRNQYGYSKARVDEITEDVARSIESFVDSENAEIDRDRTNRQSKKRRRELYQMYLDTLSKGRLGAIREGEVVGAQQKAQDQQVQAHYASTLANLPESPISQVPMMQLQTPSMGERVAGVAGDFLGGLTAAGGGEADFWKGWGKGKETSDGSGGLGYGQPKK